MSFCRALKITMGGHQDQFRPRLPSKQLFAARWATRLPFLGVQVKAQYWNLCLMSSTMPLMVPTLISPLQALTISEQSDSMTTLGYPVLAIKEIASQKAKASATRGEVVWILLALPVIRRPPPSLTIIPVAPCAMDLEKAASTLHFTKFGGGLHQRLGIWFLPRAGSLGCSCEVLRAGGDTPSHLLQGHARPHQLSTQGLAFCSENKRYF